MAYKAVFTAHASIDLTNIFNYISIDLSNRNAAKTLFETIEEKNKLSRLSEFFISKETLKIY